MHQQIKHQIESTRKNKTQLICLDLETMTIHNVLSIDYYDEKITMENDECGCTSNSLKNVKLLTNI